MSDPFARPTNSDFLNAINATKFPNDNSARPTGYVLLYSSASDTEFAAHGLSANAYLNPATGQIITAYNGPLTTPGSPADPVLAGAARDINWRIAQNDASVTREMQIKVDNFNQEAKNAAISAGYSFTKDNVFVTGNSGGGVFAQISSLVNGFAGATYGSPGIAGNGSNLREDTGLNNYYDARDVVANTGSDRFNKPLAGSQYHYGNDIELGNPSDQGVVAGTLETLRSSTDVSTMSWATGALLAYTQMYHGFDSYGRLLGVNLNKPQTVNAVDLDSMPDAIAFLRNADAIKGSINWNADNVPTLTLQYQDGSTATISVDALSSGQYSFLYDQRLQNGQGRTSVRVDVASIDQIDGSPVPFTSQKISTFDLNDALQTQRDVFAAGNEILREFDTANNRIWDERDISTDPTDKVTNVQLKLNNETTTRSAASSVDFSAIGQVFGSAIGKAIAGNNNQFVQLAAGTVAGYVGQKFVQALINGRGALDLAKLDIGDVFNGQGVSLAGAGLGAASSFLTAELATSIGLTGVGAQMFNAAVGGYVGSVLEQVRQQGFNVLTASINWDAALHASEVNVASAFGSFLAHQFVPAESQYGAIGGQLAGAIGSALAYSFSVTLGSVLNVVFPGIGAFFGTIIGTIIGDVIAGDPGSPKAAHNIEILGSDYHFTNRLIGTDDHGNAAISKEMGDQVVKIADSFLDAVHGAGIAYAGKVDIGYNTGAAPYPYVTGWFPNGTEVTPHFASASDAIQEGVRELLMQTQVIGGDLMAKRAQQAFIHGPHANPNDNPSDFTDLATLGGDLRTAQDYQQYLNDRETINALIELHPDSAFTAGWAATFARVKDLGLNHVNGSDFLGGLAGWADSVKKAGLGGDASNVSFNQIGGTAIIEIKVANGSNVPGALSVFADQVNQRSDATGTTLQFVFNNGLVPLGFHGPSSMTLVSGEWKVDGSLGNNLWFGSNSTASVFNAAGDGNDILIGGAASEHIHAGEGWNFVDGGDGGDWITSGSGNDILHGGRGGDYLQGGGGNDSYTFSRGDGADTVDDDYRYMVLDSTGSPAAPGSTGGSTHEVHANGGADTLVFGAGIGIADVSVQGNGQDVIVGVKNPGNPGATFAQLTDKITLKNWGDALNRIESLSFADGTVLSIADSSALAALRVPFGAALSNNRIAENAANGTAVGTVTGYDLDTDARLHYALLDNAGGRFAINAATGVITVANGNLLDYEAAHSYQVTVRTLDDSSYSIDRPFTINVTDVNEVFTGNAGDNTFTYSSGHYVFNGGNGGFDTVDMSHFSSAVLVNLNISGTQVYTTDAATLQQGSWRPLVDLSGGVENAVGANANTTFFGDAHDNRFTYAGGHDTFDGGGGFDTLDMSRVGSAVLINLNVPGTQVYTTDAASLQQGSWRSLVDLTGGVENAIGANAETRFVGDAHDNTFTYAGGHDSFEGGGGFDTLDLSRVGSAVLVNLNISGTQVWTTDAATLQQGSWRPLVDLTDSVENVIGANANTSFVGDSHANVFTGRAGNDVFDGEGGNDVLNGGGGNDILHGGPGDDYLAGGGGGDSYTFDRGDGADTVVDDGGSDALVFGAGISIWDISLRGTHSDVIVGVKGPAHPNTPFEQLTDKITLTNWADPLDRIEKLGFADGTVLSIADGSALAALRVPFGAALSNNRIAENAADGTVVGTVTGFDLDADARLHYALLDNAGGRFAINAATGVITVANGNLLDYEAAASHQVTVRTADDASYSIDKTFSIAVTDVNEVFTGDAGDNTFSYIAGHYAFNGGNGGFDTVDMSHFASAVLVNLNVAGTQVYTTDAATLQQGSWRSLVDLTGGVENVIGANANTTFDGDAHDNRFTYAGGHDTFDGGGGFDTLDMSRFTSAVLINLNVAGTQVYTTDAATLQQGSWRSLVDLTGGVENVIGASANTNFVGDSHANVFTGRAGNDVFDGEGGNDILTGGAGDDRFIFAPGYGSDTITDFTAGALTDDKIDLTAFGKFRMTDILNRATQTGADTVIDFGNGDKITLQNVDKNSLNTDDFIGVTNPTADDFSGDGKSDLLFLNNTTHGVAVWQMNGLQRTADAQVAIMNAAGGWRYENTGDFNGDGKTDLLFQNDITHGIAVWQMNGTQLAADGQVAIMNAAGGWRFADTGDYNGDGKTDLLFLNDTTHGVVVWQMDGLHIDHDALVGTINAAGGWYYADKGDFNGDGKTDLLFQNDTTHGVAVWQMDGTQRTADAQVGTIDTAAGWHYARTGDFNGDGKTDLLMLNDTTHDIAIWQMNGTQGAANTQVGTFNAAGGWRFVDVGDFNGDGKADLLFQNDTTHGVAVWQMNGTQLAADGQVGIMNAAADWHLVV